MANVIWNVINVLQRIVLFLSLDIPRRVLGLLSWGGVITLELNFVKLALLVFASAILLNYYVKYKYLARYAKLPDMSQKQVPKSTIDLNPDVQADARNGLHNYLDEFLSAIRVFGYLERPVFHELARHLVTRRLSAGETLSLTDDKSFYIVVDGKVQVFAQPERRLRETGRSTDAYDDEDDNGFRLINEVGSGGTLSSLFTILSLFTEDVKLRYEPQRSANGPYSHSPRLERRASINGKLTAIEDITELDLDTPMSPSSGRARHRRTSDQSADARHTFRTSPLREMNTFGANGASQPDADRRFQAQRQTRPPLRALSPPFGRSYQSQIVSEQDAADKDNETIIARATVDATLAVLPAEAFRKLTKRYPNAAAHIVQVILTRLQRVTFLTAHKYLGLTKEVVRTEKAINEMACYPLPPSFYESGGIHRLRQRFLPETKAVDSGVAESEQDYFALDPPPYAPRDAIRLKRRQPPEMKRNQTRGAGDLMSMTSLDEDAHEFTKARHLHQPAGIALQSPTRTPVASPPSTTSSRTFSLPLNDEFDLRTEVMTCISRSIGLESHSASAGVSVENSPALSAADADRGAPLGRQAAFNSSFGSLSFLDAHARDEETTVSASSVAGFNDRTTELENEVEILYFPKGATLVKAGQRNAGLFFVIDGFLEVSMPTDQAEDASLVRGGMSLHPTRDSKSTENNEIRSKPLFSVKAGGIAGYLSSLSGFPSYVDIRAKTEVYVGFLPAKALERIMDRKPIVLLTLAKRLTGLISPLVAHIDSALDWVHANAGQVLYRQGDVSDCFYIVIQGRLRAIVEGKDGEIDIRNEYGQGDSVGEIDSITDVSRPSTLHAIRDSELARMPMTLFNAIAVRHPGITIHMTRIIASRVREAVDNKSKQMPGDTGQNNFNLKTVAILPVSQAVPVTQFADRLRRSLLEMGAPTSYLNQATIMQVLGRHAFSRMGKLKLAGWLGENEQRYRIVLYVADTPVTSPWTQTCIRQADCILLVAHGDGDYAVGEYERLLLNMKTTARKELVLLHPERFVPSGQTRPWLQARGWIHAHHHVEMANLPNLRDGPVTLPFLEHGAPAIVLRRLRDLREKLPPRFRGDTSGLRSLPERAHNPTTSDFARLARRLCGKSIGLVLGGGGARGLSHLGAIRALQEQGIPIDMVGGTSIGAFIGGLYAREGDLVSALGRAKRFSGRMSTLWRILTDVTWPVVAYTTGHEFNRGIFKSFSDYQIEDLWLSFFAITTNITWSRMEIHTRGYAWRYVRASMSLAGLLPPLCDQGDMLVDGGYFDNLPVSVMRSHGASGIFAIDVGAVDDTSPRNFGESVSGWWILFNRWNPWSNARQVPTITEVQSRLTYVSSVKTLEEAKAMPEVLYMRMPVTEYATMDFKKFDEIMQVGYRHSQKTIGEWSRENMLPKVFVNGGLDSDLTKRRAGARIRRASI